MIIQCVKCRKFCNEEDGMILISEQILFIGTKEVYIFKCKNCMNSNMRKKFDEFQKQKIKKK